MTRITATVGFALAATALLAGEVSAQDATSRGGRRDGQQATQDQTGRTGSGTGQTGTRGGTRPVTAQTPATPAAPPAPAPVVQPTRPVVAAPIVTSRPQISDPKPDLRRSTETRGIDIRETQQAREIERGRRNGSLTAGEYTQLRAEQDRINELERRAKADGTVSRDERAQIRRAQADAERHIQQETHDNEGRSPRRHWGWSRGWW
jgi:hypothetical protein